MPDQPCLPGLPSCSFGNSFFDIAHSLCSGIRTPASVAVRPYRPRQLIWTRFHRHLGKCTGPTSIHEHPRICFWIVQPRTRLGVTTANLALCRSRNCAQCALRLRHCELKTQLDTFVV